jgi:branched-chain amino acid transport system substrate-binding protein
MKNRFISATAVVATGALALAGFTALPAGAARVAPQAIPTYTIGYEGPLSGGNAQLGLNMVYAVHLAIQQWNAKKGTHFKLKFATYNDQGDPTISPTEAHLAVSNKNLVAIVGPAFSGATKAAQAIYGPAHMPLVSPSATNPLLITPKEDPDHNFFRVVADDIVQGQTDGRYIVHNLHDANVYVVNDASTYGSGLAAQVVVGAKADHATVNTQTVDGTTQCQAGSGDASEYGAAATSIINKHPKMVFYGGYYCDFSLLTAALRGAGYHGGLMSGDGSDDPHYVTGTTPRSDANGAYLTCACQVLGHTAADNAFTAGFKKLSHNTPPGTYSPESYDATNTIIAAMQRVSGTITRAKIVAALRSVTWHGLTKTIHFLASGNVAGTTVFVSQVRAGKIVQIGVE